MYKRVCGVPLPFIHCHSESLAANQAEKALDKASKAKSIDKEDSSEKAESSEEEQSNDREESSDMEESSMEYESNSEESDKVEYNEKKEDDKGALNYTPSTVTPTYKKRKHIVVEPVNDTEPNDNNMADKDETLPTSIKGKTSTRWA
jgi:hypothetical protein